MSEVAQRPLLFLGIGGMGMAPLALWFAHSGRTIVGHDDGMSEPVRRLLVEAGVELRDFSFEEEIGSFDRVVHSSTLDRTHP